MIEVATETITYASVQWDLIIGGFALFLFGIQYMGDGLKSIAGDKLRDIIDKYTSKPWKGILIGALITLFIQSSSATTAIAIGFVRAGLMRLDQAIGVIMGANIGTTITAVLIGLNIEKFALYFVFVGVLIVVFSKRKKTTYAGQILLGFGLLFFGLKLMGDQLSLFGQFPQFESFATAMADQPLLGLLAGTVMTGVVQSSSAVIGIIQKLYDAGAITLVAALPFVFGSNIGTTVTAVIAALGGSLASRRAAGVHVLFNVTGTVIFMCLLYPLVALINTLTVDFAITPMMQIALAHIIFNITTTIVAYPFIGTMVAVIKKVIRGDEQERIEVKLDDLNPKLANELPAGALGISKQATLKMGELSIEAINATKEYFNTGSSKHNDIAHQYEDAINSLDNKITEYLMVIAHQSLGQHDTDELIENLQVIKNIERIGDIAMNLAEFYEMAYDEKGKFSDAAKKDVNDMYEVVNEMIKMALEAFDTKDENIVHRLEDRENYLDLIEEKARQRHFKRMATDECRTAITGSVYVDILGNLERIGDHACNIASIKNVPQYVAPIKSENIIESK
ncbi:MAG: Na/Pi cotransporter family protein [Erysipelotrichaceae bacterium]